MKNAIKAMVFILLFLVMLRSLTYMLRTNGPIKDIFVGFYAEPEDTIDVVMIGSSPVYPCYAAPQLWGEHGIAAYPLSSNVQRPKAAVYLVKEALKTQSPSLFIFELRQFTAADSYMMTYYMEFSRGVTDNLKYSVNRIDMIRALVPEEDRYSYYFDIFKYHSNWRSLILSDQRTAFIYERLHPLKGLLIHEEVVPGEKKDYSDITEELAIPPEQEEVLCELMTYLKENELQALFIVSPMVLTKELTMQFNYMERIITENGGTFLDLNDYYEEIGLDFARDFYDGGSHTNASGSEKCTAFLGAYLEENYHFTDKRGDEAYAEWDVAYAYWLECQAAALETIEEKVANGNYDVGEAE
ncbi:MAG: SGNH/GDSL hydrolase family protein [Lachnospiraceae bacterium]|nr:SGNH/GDSL hydrolase family protein [Lachnospiraceae bacterium]